MKWLTILAILFNITLLGNDGWFSGVKGESGELYATGEHFAISMEEELLSYEPQSGGIDIFYLFKNHKDKAVTVEAAFPIEFLIPVKFDKKGKLKAILPDAGGDISKDHGTGGFLAKLNKKQPALDRVIKVRFKEFMALQKGINPTPVPYFEMKQGGKKVTIDQVLIERKKMKKAIKLVIHFQHKLNFKASEQSILTVRYDIDAPTGDGMSGTHRNWSYLLGSARGWRGAIKRIYLVLPKVARFQHDEKLHTKISYPEGFQVIGQSATQQLLYRENYEPELDDHLKVQSYHWLVVGNGTAHHELKPVDKTVKTAPKKLLSKHFKKHISLVDYFHHEGMKRSEMKVALKLRRWIINGNLKQINEDYPESTLMLLERKTLRYMRNMIIAKYGYQFKDHKLDRFFRRFKWYKPKNNPKIALTKGEKKRIALIKAVEEMKK